MKTKRKKEVKINQMKRNKVFSVIFIGIFLVGIIGAAAALTKNFSVIPDVLISHSEEVIEHKETAERTESEVLTKSDLSDALYFRMEMYERKTSWTGGYASHEFGVNSIDNNIVYEAVYNHLDDDYRWGMKIEAILKNGLVKKYYCGMDSNIDNTISYEYPENLGRNYLICFSKNGAEPNLESDIENVTPPEDGWKKLQIIDSELGFKFYIYGTDQAQFINEEITTFATDNNGWVKEDSGISYHYDQPNNKFLSFSYNVSDIENFYFSINIKQNWTDKVREYNHETIINTDVSGYDTILVTYCYKNDDFNPLDYDEEIGTWTISNGAFVGKLFVHGIYKVVEHEHTFATSWTHDETSHWHAATCEHTTLTNGLAEHNFGDDNICDDCGYTKPTPIIPTEIGTYKLTFTRNDFALLSEDFNVLLIDTDNMSNDIDDTLFYLISVETKYDGQRIDYWDSSPHSYDRLANSLEIHQDGSSLESQITGKGDGYIGHLGNWYIDGFITPSEINYTLEIIIEINQIGKTSPVSNFTDAFLSHYEKIN